MTFNNTETTSTNEKETPCALQDVNLRPTAHGEDARQETPQNETDAPRDAQDNSHDTHATGEPTANVESSNASPDNAQKPPRTPMENNHPTPPRTPTEKNHPAPAHKPFEQDTPSTGRVSHSNNFRNADLNERRTILAQDCRSANIVSTNYFFSNLLPPLPEGVPSLMDDIVKVLLNKGRLGYKEEGELSWKCFDPKKKEDHHYMPLLAIFEDSVQLISNRLHIENTHTYVSRPNTRPVSDKHESMRPDGAIIKGCDKPSSITTYEWYDIACVGEFKKAAGENDVTDLSLLPLKNPLPIDSSPQNIPKIVYGMHHMLACDAARRFAFGFTVEKDNMSLWHASRAALLKCDFNYKKVHVVLALPHIQL